MAFPRKNTRRLSVDGLEYQWHLNDDWDRRDRWIVICRRLSVVGQLLMIDPYHHDFLPTRSRICQAVRFALSNGWNPHNKSEPIRLRFRGHRQGFEVLSAQPK